MNDMRLSVRKPVAVAMPEKKQDALPAPAPDSTAASQPPARLPNLEAPPLPERGPWNHQSLTRLGRTYGLGDPAEWQGVAVQSRSRLRFTVGERELVLRAIDTRANGALALRSELALMGYLREHRFPVAAPIKNRAGTEFSSVGAFLYVLTAPAGGTPYCTDHAHHRREAGDTLAHLHELLLEYAGPVPMGSAPWFTAAIDQRLDWIQRRAELSTRSTPGPLTQRFSQDLTEAAESARRVYGHEGVEPVHGAYDGAALTFDAEGSAVVDRFDNICQDLRVAELARAVSALCVTTDPGDPYDPEPILGQALESDFLAAYERRSPLSKEERAALPALLSAIYLIRLVDDCRGLVETWRRYGGRPGLLQDGPLSYVPSSAPSGVRDRRSAD